MRPQNSAAEQRSQMQATETVARNDSAANHFPRTQEGTHKMSQRTTPSGCVVGLGLALAVGAAAQPTLAQSSPNTDMPIAELAGQPLLTARQSSDYREDTGAEVALPTQLETFVVPSSTTPAYTQVELNPWWQMDLRARRDMSTVSARACEGYTGTGEFGVFDTPDTNDTTDLSDISDTSDTTDPLPEIACNADYDLTGAWLLVSDLPFPNDPWAASVADDPAALISRFPIISNGFLQAQVATVNRSGRYVRIQFQPGTQRALAIEKLDIRGMAGISESVIALNTAFDAIFPETLALLDNLVDYRDAAFFTDEEVGELHGRGKQLERAAKKAKSIATRISKLDANLTSAISLLGKVEVISTIKTPARAMKETLKQIRRAVRPLKNPANRAREKFETARSKLHDLNGEIRNFRAALSTTVAWASSEETAVTGLYHSQTADPDDPIQLIDQPLPAPLEGYSGFRNAQFELTEINARTRDLGSSTEVINDNIQDVEDAVSLAIEQMTDFDAALISIETALNTLLTPLRELNGALGQRVCVPRTDICMSVDDVLEAIEEGKSFFGLSILEDLVNDILDPIIGEITRPIAGAFPSVPALLRDLMNTPSIFNMTEANEVIEHSLTTDALWDDLNSMLDDVDGGAA